MLDSNKNETRKQITRRQFFKFAWEGAKYLAGAALIKFFYDLHKNMFRDVEMLTRCLAADAETRTSLYERELRPAYETALVVVHPGYGILRNPERYRDRQDYLSYLQNLRNTVEAARKNEDLIIFLVGAQNVRLGQSVKGLEPEEADLAIATRSDAPEPISCIETPSGSFIYQQIATPRDLNALLEKKAIKTIKIAGEYREACVALSEVYLSPTGAEITLLEDAIY